MQINLQTSLLFGTICTLAFIFITIKKTNMNIRYSIAWISWGVIVLIFSLFPSLIDVISSLLSISVPTNTVFLVFMFLLYIMSFYLFIKVSKLTDEIKTLTYSIAKLKQQVEQNDEK